MLGDQDGGDPAHRPRCWRRALRVSPCRGLLEVLYVPVELDDQRLALSSHTAFSSPISVSFVLGLGLQLGDLPCPCPAHSCSSSALMDSISSCGPSAPRRFRSAISTSLVSAAELDDLLRPCRRISLLELGLDGVHLRLALLGGALQVFDLDVLGIGLGLQLLDLVALLRSTLERLRARTRSRPVRLAMSCTDSPAGRARGLDDRGVERPLPRAEHALDALDDVECRDRLDAGAVAEMAVPVAAEARQGLDDRDRLGRYRPEPRPVAPAEYPHHRPAHGPGYVQGAGVIAKHV